MKDKLAKASIKFFSDPKNLRVVKGYCTDGVSQMKAGCHHRKGFGYCGGCAARIDMVVNVVEKLLDADNLQDALKVIAALHAARVAESPRHQAPEKS